MSDQQYRPPPQLPPGGGGHGPVPYVGPHVPVGYQQSAVPTVAPRRRGFGFWALITGGLIAGLLAAMACGFFIGQGTRQSDQQVNARLAAASLSKQRALLHQRRVMAHGFSSRLQKIIDRVANAAQSKGYQQGRDAGYSSGQSAGFSAGQSAGFTQGTCYTPLTLQYVC